MSLSIYLAYVKVDVKMRNISLALSKISLELFGKFCCGKKIFLVSLRLIIMLTNLSLSPKPRPSQKQKLGLRLSI